MTLRQKLLLVPPVLLLAIQAVRFEQTNPPVTQELDAPPEVRAVLERACYDCHSNKTVYPWYSNLAPGSWLMHRDVVEGRKELNFTEWDKVREEKKGAKLRHIVKETKEGEMPPWFYLPLHSAAKLSDADRALLAAWVLRVAGPAPAKKAVEKHHED